MKRNETLFKVFNYLLCKSIVYDKLLKEMLVERNIKHY